MLQLAIILFWVSVATCSILSFNGSYPLSVPLPDGTMALNCTGWLDKTNTCALDDSCCTDAKGVLLWTYMCFCLSDLRADDYEMAYNQYDANAERNLCQFNGHAVLAPQLQLTANATAILNNFDAQDEQLRQEQAIFFALQIVGGHVGLPILLIVSTLLQKSRRDLTFLNFCFTWVFSSVVSSIGLYRRGPASSIRTSIFAVTLPYIHSDQECLAQAALTIGAQVMTDTSMCALIIQIFLNFRAALYGPLGCRQAQCAKAALLVVPYAALLGFFLPAIILRPRLDGYPAAFPGKFYCVLDSEDMFIPMYATMLVILVVSLICDACIIRILYCRWRNQSFPQSPDKGLRISLSLVLRVILFCVYRVVVAIAYGVVIVARVRALGRLSTGVSLHDFASLVPVWTDMLQAATPLVAFLVFGISKEYLDALVFWRTPRPVIPTTITATHPNAI